MYAILRALGVGEGDDVILPGYTCVMDVNPIKYLGARPVFVDIEPTTYNLDVSLLRERITSNTKVIVAQHTYGYPCEMDALMDIADRHGIPVIEDCCLAVGSRYKGKLCGTFGVASYWSFQWNKPFTTGIGGMATTDDPELIEKIESICQEELLRPPFRMAAMLSVQRLAHSLLIYPSTAAAARLLYRWLGRKGLLVASSSACEYGLGMPDGFFTGMSGGQGRAGLGQMKRLDRNIAHRKKMSRIYAGLLDEAGWQVPALPTYMEPVLMRYPARVADKAAAVSTAAVHFVELGYWFETPLHPAPFPLASYGYHRGMCPVAEKAARQVVNLPTHPRTNERVARRSVEFIRNIGPAK